MPGMWDELERIFAADSVQIGEWCSDVGNITNILRALLQIKMLHSLSEMLLAVRATLHRLTGSGQLTWESVFIPQK